MTKRSQCMEGLLWAEDCIAQGIFFEEDKTGVDTLHWELYYSGEYYDCHNYWFKGACDYLDNSRSRMNG